MRFLYLKTQIVGFSLFIILSRVISAWQSIPSIHGPLEFITRQEYSEGDPGIRQYARKNVHLSNPYKFSCFFGCPINAGLLIRGGPCRPVQAVDCGGFSCGCGIGFPISSVSCRNERNKPDEINTTAKRFDITGFPAAHKAKHLTRKRPLPYEAESSKPDEKEQFADDEGSKNSGKNVFPHPTGHHQPWRPYLHKPMHPPQAHFRILPSYWPFGRDLPSVNYWRFQGYFPHMGWKTPWKMDPYNVRNLRYYPEYQYVDVGFTQPTLPFQPKPRLREYNDRISEDQPEEQQEYVTHSKQRVGQLQEEDRKMVDSQYDSKDQSEVQDDISENKDKLSGQTNPIQANDDHGDMVSNEHKSSGNFDEDNGAEEEVLEKEFSDHAVEEEETRNFPEYASELNTDPFLPAKKRHAKGMNTFNETEIRQRGKGFDLDAYFKRKEQTKVGKKARKGLKVSSGLGDVRIKYDILSSQTSHQGFSRR